MVTEVLKNITRDKTMLMIGSLVFIAYLSLQGYKAIQELKINKQRLILNDLQLQEYSSQQQ